MTLNFADYNLLPLRCFMQNSFIHFIHVVQAETVTWRLREFPVHQDPHSSLPSIILELSGPCAGFAASQVDSTSAGRVRRLLLERSRYVRFLM